MSTNIANTYDVCMNKAKELRFHVVSPGLIIAKRADVFTVAGKKALTNVKDLFFISKLKERKPEGDYVMFPADITESHADVKQCKIGTYGDLKKLIIENHSKGVFYAS